MKIALNISAVTDDQKSLHKVRGIGTYTHELFTSLCKYAKNDEIVGFTHENELPTDVDVVHYPYFDPYFFFNSFQKKKKNNCYCARFYSITLYGAFSGGKKRSFSVADTEVFA